MGGLFRVYEVDHYYSPSTGETLPVSDREPSVEEQERWIEAHQDAVLLTPLEQQFRKF